MKRKEQAERVRGRRGEGLREGGGRKGGCGQAGVGRTMTGERQEAGGAEAGPEPEKQLLTHSAAHLGCEEIHGPFLICYVRFLYSL